jgi:hypothetical protein
MTPRNYEVTDDSGFLAIVDPDSYVPFVDAEWTLDQLVERFESEMQSRHLLIWGTGREGNWRVEVRFDRSADRGFREFSSVICASGKRLLLTNYESLTMAAQFRDVLLPERHQEDLLIPLAPSLYACRVVQLLDPESPDSARQVGAPDFFIELTAVPGAGKIDESISGIPWSDLTRPHLR